MNFKYTNLLVFLLAIVVSTVFWDQINIPLSSEILLKKFENLENLHNAYNDIARFIVFLSIPIISLIIYYQKKENNFFKNLNEVLRFEKYHYCQNKNNSKELNFFTILIFFILIIEFFSLNFTEYNHHVDIFHEGMWLSASENLKHTGELWNSSFVVRGLFGDFHPYFLWEIFGKETIGITRFFNLIIFFLNKIIILLIVRKISLFSNLDNERMILFFLTLSFLLISLQGYVNPVFLVRSFLLLLFILFVLNFCDNYGKNFFYTPILGLFSCLSFFWYLDIGLYINLFLLIFIFYFIFKFDFKNFFLLIMTICLSWLVIFIFLPRQEFFEFISNTHTVITTLSWLHGLEFPAPFVSLDARSGKSILMFLFTSYMLINFINFYKKEESIFLFSLIFLYIVSALYFNYALGRSDGGHIRVGSGILFIPFFSILLFHIFKNIKFDKVKKRNFFNFGIISLIFISTVFINKKYENKNIKNIVNFNSSISKLINYEDNEFINEEYEQFIDYYKNLTKDEKCITIFTNEVAFFYFLKKPSCSKYYFMFTAPPKKIQINLIKDISETKPMYIIYKSEKDIFYNSQLMLKDVDKFINETYFFLEKYKSWEIYKKKVS